MMRSLYSAVSGLKTHQTKMDVIGNNIANVNTVGYKSQSVTFQDVMYQTTQAATGANATTGRGGTNAKQIGLGSTTGAISSSIATAGASQTTNDPFDIQITGNSFFIVSDGNSNYFTRSGAFAVDSSGNLVTKTNGYTVMGWQADGTGNIVKDTVSPLQIMSANNQTSKAEATTKATITGILDSNASGFSTSSGYVMSLSFYDAMGYKYTAKFSVHSAEGATNGTTHTAANPYDVGDYYVTLDSITDSSGNTVNASEYTFGSALNLTNVSTTTTTLAYTNTNLADTTSPFNVVDPSGTAYTIDDSTGNVVLTNTSTGTSNTLYTAGTPAGTTYSLSSDPSGNIILTTNTTSNITNNGIIISYDDTGNGEFTGINEDSATTNSILNFGNAFGQFADITIDWSGTSMGNNDSTCTLAATPGASDKTTGTGRSLGSLTGVSIDTSGKIYGSYDNGDEKLLGQIAVASFANPSGLEKVGSNLYSTTLNSGDFDGVGQDVSADGGSMATGVLEMSNVDLSSEFTEMITTQRGFQANSRIITTSDSLLEELINLKR